MYMYVTYARISLAAVGGRFDGYVNQIGSSWISAVSVTVPTNPPKHCFSSARFKGEQEDILVILSFTVLLP